MRFSTFAFLLSLIFASFTSVQAQSSPALLATNDAPAAASSGNATMLISGRVESVSGPLVGAVVSVPGKSYQKAVTNSNGDFRLSVPATTEPVNIMASYAGFKDKVTSVRPGTTLAPIRLTDVQATPNLPRKQQLKRYIKVAHKEAKRESRQLHRN